MFILVGWPGPTGLVGADDSTSRMHTYEWQVAPEDCCDYVVGRNTDLYVPEKWGKGL